MKSIEYNNYVREVIQLTRSLIIKSEHTISAINTYLAALGDTVSADPYTWKYYQNLNGEYYTGTSGLTDDVPMTVRSLDTKVMVPFTKAVLNTMPFTRAEYSSKGSYYRTLVAQYPDQQMLIDGIINPIDSTTAIGAKDCQILHYDSTLVAYNEKSLIAGLQLFIYRYLARWDVAAFAVTDSLYPASFIANLYLAIVPTILNLRLSMAKTREVHPFHLWSYLGGYYDLDRFKNGLDYRQALFLYKNMGYIEYMAGKGKTLDFIYDNIGKPFNLLMNTFKLEHDSSQILVGLNAGGKKTTPDVVTGRFDYTNRQSEALSYLTPADTVTTLLPLASLNTEFVSDDIATITNQPDSSLMGSTQTGVLEFSRQRSLNELLANRTSVSLNNWVYMSSEGYYPLTLKLSINLRDKSVLVLSSSEALTLAMYLAAKYQGDTLTTIPNVLARDIPVGTTRTPTVLARVIEETYLHKHIRYGDNVVYRDMYSYMENAVSSPSTIPNYNAFSDYIDNVILTNTKELMLIGMEDDPNGKQQYINYMSQWYTDKLCTISTYATYTDFFTSIDYIPPVDITNGEIITLLDNIISAFVGVSDTNSALGVQLSSIKDIIGILASYTVLSTVKQGVSELIPLDIPSLYYRRDITSIVNTLDIKWQGTTQEVYVLKVIDASVDNNAGVDTTPLSITPVDVFYVAVGIDIELVKVAINEPVPMEQPLSSIEILGI